MVNEELLNIYGCPICKSRLSWNQEARTLTCVRCNKIYNITKSDVPILLTDEAEYARRYKQNYNV